MRKEHIIVFDDYLGYIKNNINSSYKVKILSGMKNERNFWARLISIPY